MSGLPIFKNNHAYYPFAIWDPFSDISPPHIPPHSNRVSPFSGGANFGWNESPEAYVTRVNLHGVKKEEVKVKVREGRFVKISGRKKVEREERHENWHHAERSEGKFSKVLTLPENCRADHVGSCLEDGVLTVTAPKRVVKKSHGVKDIEVKG